MAVFDAISFGATSPKKQQINRAETKVPAHLPELGEKNKDVKGTRNEYRSIVILEAAGAIGPVDAVPAHAE